MIILRNFRTACAASICGRYRWGQSVSAAKTDCFCRKNTLFLPLKQKRRVGWHQKQFKFLCPRCPRGEFNNMRNSNYIISIKNQNNENYENNKSFYN